MRVSHAGHQSHMKVHAVYAVWRDVGFIAREVGSAEGAIAIDVTGVDIFYESGSEIQQFLFLIHVGIVPG